MLQLSNPQAELPSIASIDVGNTPLLELRRLCPSETVRLYAKAEWLNPGGSVKDRPALWMIREGERTGALTSDKMLLDATSGNTGIAYAWLGRRLGIQVRLCVPGSINAERRRILEAYGVDLLLTDPMEGSDGAIRMAKWIYAENPELYFYPDQYNNPANWKAHYESTAPEIWRQTRNAGVTVTHFVAGLGTSGSFTGTGKRLREFNQDITLISVQPDSAMHGLEGLKHMPTSIRPGFYDSRLADENASISTEEAYATVHRLAKEEGILAGVSGGANVAAAIKTVQRLEEEGRRGAVVTLLPDAGERYLGESFWSSRESSQRFHH
jgi:S-sulfo-L-cysteine synthase (O-acetyl-L-serine-dependent)